MNISLLLKVFFYCLLLCVSNGLVSLEDQKTPSIQQTHDTKMHGNWYRKELESPSDSLPPFHIAKSKKIITSEDLKDLKEYIQDTQFSGVVYLSDEKNTYRISSEQFESLKEDELIFAIHSIGKVYTGILTLIMLQEGVIKESSLFSPLEVATSVMHSLPLNVQQHIKVTTLYETMVHRGGFGDYLGKYVDAIQGSLKAQQTPPILHHPEDFLPFSDEEVFNLEPGESRYSNLGILLLGLSIQYHYQKLEPLDYNSILKKYILDGAGIALFCSKPPHGNFNQEDAIAGYLCGSPAGGYWTTVKHLHAFGEWVRQKCIQDSDFMGLVEKYGQEFYSADNREIAHGGGIPSSSAFFSVFLDNGITIAIASDKANKETSRSSHLYNTIVRNILLYESKE
jgi:hypothetical protein